MTSLLLERAAAPDACLAAALDVCLVAGPKVAHRFAAPRNQPPGAAVPTRTPAGHSHDETPCTGPSSATMLMRHAPAPLHEPSQARGKT